MLIGNVFLLLMFYVLIVSVYCVCVRQLLLRLCVVVCWFGYLVWLFACSFAPCG